MDDVQSLRQQVRKLQRRLDAIEGTPDREVVREIVGTPARPDHLTGFAAAVADSRSSALKETYAKIERELRNDPAAIATPALEAEFRSSYPSVPPEMISSIIRRVKRDV